MNRIALALVSVVSLTSVASAAKLANVSPKVRREIRVAVRKYNNPADKGPGPRGLKMLENKAGHVLVYYGKQAVTPTGITGAMVFGVSKSEKTVTHLRTYYIAPLTILKGAF